MNLLKTNGNDGDRHDHEKEEGTKLGLRESRSP